MGSFLSLLVTCVVLAYAYLKADVLLSRRDVDTLSTIDDNKFTPDDVFGYEDGFSIAIALTAYDNNPMPILDPTYGEIVFTHTVWGQTDDGLI